MSRVLTLFFHPPCPWDPEFHHLMVTAGWHAHKAVFDLHIPNKPLLGPHQGPVVQWCISSNCLLYHLEEEVIINAFQELPGLWSSTVLLSLLFCRWYYLNLCCILNLLCNTFNSDGINCLPWLWQSFGQDPQNHPRFFLPCYLRISLCVGTELGTGPFLLCFIMCAVDKIPVSFLTITDITRNMR